MKTIQDENVEPLPIAVRTLDGFVMEMSRDNFEDFLVRTMKCNVMRKQVLQRIAELYYDSNENGPSDDEYKLVMKRLQL
jgi:hypothetical protein